MNQSLIGNINAQEMKNLANATNVREVMEILQKAQLRLEAGIKYEVAK